jgi:hypothetical protein
MSENYALTVINREIKRLNKRLASTIASCEYKPAAALGALHDEARIKFSSFENKSDPKLIKWMEDSAKKEKAIINSIKQGNAQKHWDTRLELEIKLNDLCSATYRFK